MGRKYSVSFSDVAVTAVQDLFQIEQTDGAVQLLACYLSQRTDVGDAESESLLIEIAKITDAVTNSATEVALNADDSASSCNLNINQTSQLTTGKTVLHAECWNILQPFIYLPPPETRLWVPSGDAIAVKLETAPADSITMSGTLYFEEI